jgi:hypothetical protein
LRSEDKTDDDGKKAEESSGDERDEFSLSFVRKEFAEQPHGIDQLE